MAKQVYFLGANSSRGFYSCYAHFCRPEDGNFLWVIKGGPGCGKSSFMRKIGTAAEKMGLNVEYVICSGDPDSLDGVYIPSRKLGYVDGTAPHVIEPAYPGAGGSYLDLGRFYNRTSLMENLDAIISVTRAYKDCYKEAYCLLSGLTNDRGSSCMTDCPTRFRCALTCQGIHSCDYPVPTVKISRDDMDLLLKEQTPSAVYLHPIFPETVCAARIGDLVYETETKIPDCSGAVECLARAKSLHDQLEALYNPYVDFDGIYQTAGEHIANYL